MADDFTSDRTINIDLLIGLDYLWEFINPLECVKYQSLIAQQSVFGWIVSGSFSKVKFNVNNDNIQLCCFSVSNDDIKKFWDLDVIGIMPDKKHNVNKVDPIVNKFNANLEFENGRYVAN